MPVWKLTPSGADAGLDLRQAAWVAFCQASCIRQRVIPLVRMNSVTAASYSALDISRSHSISNTIELRGGMIPDHRLP